MTLTRKLTETDLPAIAEIINSRDAFLTSSPLDKQQQIALSERRMASGHTFVGIFEDDGSLDGYFSYHRLAVASPRADDFQRTEPACVLDSLWSRKRPNRVKLPVQDWPQGDDRNFGLLFCATVTEMENEGLFTFWGVTSKNFRGHYLNQVYAPMQAKRLTIVAAEAAPGEAPTGDLADFVKANIYRTVNPHETMICYLHTLLDAYRA